MEIRLEAVEGCKMPAGSFLAVKLGDTLKQGRYEPSRTYQFSQTDKRRHAKIDLFKHVGSSVVLVNPDAGPNVSEVCIPRGDSLIEDLRLKVDMKPQSNQKNKAAEPVKHAVRTNAQTYLSKHGIEEKLSNCVKLLLQQQPDDPVDFICCQLRGTPYPTPVTIEASLTSPMRDAAPNYSSGSYPPHSEPQPATNLAVPLSACELDMLQPHQRSEQIAPSRQVSGGSFPIGDGEVDRSRVAARQALLQACQDGSLLGTLEAVSPRSPGATKSKVTQGSVAPMQSERPTVPVQPQSAPAPEQPRHVAVVVEPEPERPRQKVSRGLAEASLDGTLPEKLQVASIGEAFAQASFDGSLVAKMQAALGQQTSPPKSTLAAAQVRPQESSKPSANLAKEVRHSLPQQSLNNEVSQKLAEATFDGSLVGGISRAESGLTATIQKALAGGSADGRLEKALQSVTPISTGDAVGRALVKASLDGSLAQKITQQVTTEYNVEFLRSEASRCFWKASQDGRLQSVLGEIKAEAAKDA